MKKLLTTTYLLALFSFNLNSHELAGGWCPAPQLGCAYNSNKHKVYAVKLVQGTEVTIDLFAEKVELTYNAGVEKINNALNCVSDIAAPVPFTRTFATMDYAIENAANDTRLNLFFKFMISNKASFLQDLKPSPFAQKMINNPIKLAKICGDEFVNQINFGAAIFATMKIEFASREDKILFEKTVSINVDQQTGDVKISGDLELIKQQMGSRTMVKIGGPRQLGGNWAGILRFCGLGSFGGDLSHLEEQFLIFKNIIQYAHTDLREQLKKTSFDSALSYQTISYKNSDICELSLNNLTAPDEQQIAKHDELQKSYIREASAQARAHHITSTLGKFVSCSQMDKVEEILKKSRKNMSILIDAMETCLKDPNLETYDNNDLDIKNSCDFYLISSC